MDVSVCLFCSFNWFDHFFLRVYSSVCLEKLHILIRDGIFFFQHKYTQLFGFFPLSTLFNASHGLTVSCEIVENKRTIE